MPNFEVPVFVMASSARYQGENSNVGDYVYSASFPMDTLHKSLQQGYAIKFGKEPMNPYSPLSYVDLIGVIPCIEEAGGIKDNKHLAKTYTISLADKKVYDTTKSYERVQMQLVKNNGEVIPPNHVYTVASTNPIPIGEMQTIDLAITSKTIINGVEKPVTTQVRLAYGCFYGSKKLDGTYEISNKDKLKISETAIIKDNSFFDKLERGSQPQKY